ncbi:MAG: phosphoadenosine phosphosulfate reductase family protein [Candidatus Thorarchaeota archaeon]
MISLRPRRGKFRAGHAPYLTKIRFYWCDECNVPRISDSPCSVCASLPRRVDISPPGDPFPAMDGHLTRARAAIDRQFGDGVGAFLLPSSKTIVMNKAPALDSMYEVIVDGHIIGRLRFDIPKLEYTFVLSLEGGRRVGLLSKRKWVRCHDDVLRFLRDGANLMVPGIADCDSGICIDDDVWITDSAGHVVGVGLARMSGTSMLSEKRGFAVKIREFSDSQEPMINSKFSTWNDAIACNSRDLDLIECEALGFIRDVMARFAGSSFVVGFSGGKDSLATYLLVEHAIRQRPTVFFMNTGLELPETLSYVHQFVSERGAKLVTHDSGDKFWESVKTFGPPARDFRWCCKILKLGPAATEITEQLGGSVLTFMGQRKFESFQRSVESRVSQNPWVPGQISANPIQNWSALEVWLYIFRSGAPFNPLYSRGYHRMGCYLCPASPLSELEELKSTHPALYQRLKEMLHDWACQHSLPLEWADLGFWRWKHLPSGQTVLAGQLGVKLSPERASLTEKLELKLVKGISPCVMSGFSIEGQFSSGLDLNRVSGVMHIFGESTYSEEMGAIKTVSSDATILLFSSGSLVIRGPDEKMVQSKVTSLDRAVRRALFCQSCGSCVPKCEQSALFIGDDGKISVNPERCVHCLACDQWPCPTYLR